MTEFRRRTRYHQAMWREAAGHPVGTQPIAPRPRGTARLVGSRREPAAHDRRPSRSLPPRLERDGGLLTELRHRKDLFKGTAEHYDRFRPPYPAALLDDLRARVPLDGTGRLLDLACGTGQVAFALAADVDEVLAVDQEAELIEFDTRKAERLGVTNIRWLAAAAEDVALEGAFDLVAVGNAFHRLDRDAVATRLLPHLPERGCVALLWGGTPWRGHRPWQRALDETLERWSDTLGARDRVPEGWEATIDGDPHEQVLRRAGLAYEGLFEFSLVERWTVESLIGFVYSTSFLNLGVLAHHVDAFESDLRERLLACCGDGVFEQDVTFAYELARRSARARGRLTT